MSPTTTVLTEVVKLVVVVTWLIVEITLIVFVATVGDVVTKAVEGVTTQEHACEIIDLTNIVRTTIRTGKEGIDI